MAVNNKAQIEEILCALLGRIADKSTLLVITVLGEESMRFSRLRDFMDVNPKILARLLRQMERDGLVTRRLYRLVPPRVDYELTPLGKSLGEAVCRIWAWAEKHSEESGRDRAAMAPMLKRVAWLESVPNGSVTPLFPDEPRVQPVGRRTGNRYPRLNQALAGS